MSGADLLDGLEGWTLQMGVWNYAVQGEITERSALLAEGHAHLLGGLAWDRTAKDLDGQQVAYAGEPYRRVKDHAALPWVTEHCIRGHAEWPRL